MYKTYAQVHRDFMDIGSGLMKMASKFPEITKNRKYHSNNTRGELPVQWHVGLYSVNREEWVVAEQACNAFSLITVALYDTLGPNALEFSINHSELGIVVCTADKIPNLLKVASKCPVLKIIVSMDKLPADQRSTSILMEWASDKNIALLDFETLQALGRKSPLQAIPPRPDDVATICYTSGTTGNPKGAMLLHKNFVVSANSIRYHSTKIDHSDLMISYLPLAHCFERVLEACMFSVGGAIGFYMGDVLNLVDDIAALKPTVFPSVPRLFNRIYAKLVDGTIKAPGVRGWIFRKAVADKLANVKAGKGLTSAWDVVLFNKVRQILGGNVKIMITGSAPIGGDVLTFLRVVFCCEILEGYGQTECAAGSTITFPGDHSVGQVGAPLVCNEIKLVDVPEMSYFSTDNPPRGEVWIRGHNVMLGYFKDPKKTSETITSDGWLKTGDIGTITPSGNLSIFDRKKNIFKLAQGEYVAPEKLEAVYSKNDYILQCYVHGDSLESVLIGVIVPDPDKVSLWAKKDSKTAKSDMNLQRLCELPELKRLIMDELQKTAKKHKLAGFERIKNIHLEWDQFTIENGLLTPSFKLKRNEAIKKYRQIIDKLYRELKQQSTGNPSARL